MPNAGRQPVAISRDVARRFLLGRSGLWPGRRWRGLRGTESAMHAMIHLQLDPLRIVARAQDLALGSRVLDYREDDWAILTHDKRRFFEWGGWLAVRPMAALPSYRVVMRRSVEFHAWCRWALEEHGPAIDEMRLVLARRREVSNRDFAVHERTRVDSYRGRKDSSVALHYLWRVGEAMVARRTPTFERVYARSNRVAPARYLDPAPDEAADDHLLLESVRDAGFSKLNAARSILLRDVTPDEVKAWRARKIEDGTLIEVQVEGLIGRFVTPAAELPDIESLAAGRIPTRWRPLGPTTTDEVTFLSPLDPVIHDRGRTRRLFGFDYKWAVYDPVHKRKFGYYDLPILYGDCLVGRADMRFDRSSPRLEILGRWHEPGFEAGPDFEAAVAGGVERLRRTLNPPVTG